MDLYLKNSTASEISINDLGIIISPGSSITIDENDIDGYLTPDMLSALGATAAVGLILSKTDIGDASGDFTRATAIERLTLKTNWKPSRPTFADLPLDGNEDGDLRLVLDSNIVYRWDQPTVEWVKTTSTYSLRVEEYDTVPSGDNVTKLVFVQAEDKVYIDASDDKAKVAYIGPPDEPLSLHNAALTISGTTLFTAGLSDGNLNYNSTAGEIFGTNVNYVINDGIFKLTTPSTSTSCNYGDKGLLKVYLNQQVVADFDLAANFNEANRDGVQSISSYNTKGTATLTPVSGVVDFGSGFEGKANFKILSVGKYNNFKFYQKFTAEINITDATCLRQGWNEIYLVHELDAALGGNQTSQKMNFFYDIDTRDGGANPSIVSAPVIAENTPVFKYLSGVKFYDAGSTFDVSLGVSRAFANVYHSSKAPVVLSGWPGLTDTAITWDNPYVSPSFTSLPNACPGLADTMSISNWQLIQGSSQLSQNARITATPRDPYGTYVPVTSASDNILIFSYAESSTALVEHFRDEKYRLLNESYDTIPASIVDQWDSTRHIGTYPADSSGLQVYMDELYFPTLNFSVGYKPLGNPDYTILENLSDRTYLRAFKHNNSVSYASGVLRLTGITKAQLYARSVEVYIKAPTQTGWLDLCKDYNFATFTGSDNDGCWVNRDVQSNSDFNFTLGGKFTELSGRMIIVKVVYPDKNSPRISYMTITNWSA